MLWVNEQYTFLFFFGAGIDFRCQNRTSLDVSFSGLVGPRTERVESSLAPSPV